MTRASYSRNPLSGNTGTAASNGMMPRSQGPDNGASTQLRIGGAGGASNPRPADYERYGPTPRIRYLHRYHGAVPPMALIAPFALVTRSTPYYGDDQMPVTERY